MILVDVYIPSLDNTFDLMLDENITIDKLIIEISEMICKKVKSSIQGFSEELFLYRFDTEKRLDNGRTLFSSGVTDGCKLMLV